MKCSLATGGYQDYIELTPETVAEASQLTMIASSKFLEPNRVDLDFSGTFQPMRLRIYVSEKRPHDPHAAEELDATP